MLTQNELLKAANNFFPNNYGVIITGSQQKNTTLKKESDIDIIVLDTLRSNQWNILAYKDGYKIEFIIMPITDIENVFDNELYDPKSGSLSLVQGKVLSDPFSIIQTIFSKIKAYFNTIQFKTYSEYGKYLTELLKLRSLFSSSLTKAEQAIVLSDFINIISLLETIRVTNWSSKTKHKLRHLNTYSPGFMEKIAILFEKGVNNDFDDIKAYINFYETSYNINHLPQQKKYSYLVVDIGYNNFSVSEFINELLPKILNNEILINAYGYFYLSPIKYHRKYKNNICIVFTIDNEDQCLQLLSFLQKSINAIENPMLNFSHFCEGNNLGTINTLVSALKISISKIILNIIKAKNDYDHKIGNGIFFTLCYYLKNGFSISNKEFQNINSFIAQKWLFTREEQQKTIDYPALMQLRAFNIDRAEQFYKNNLPMLLQLVLADKDTIVNTEVDLVEVFNIAEDIFKQSKYFTIPENDINEAIFKTSNFTDIKTIWLYKIVIESILLILNIPDSEKFNALYSCSKAVAELGAEAVAV
jgi:hypothetical protein